MDALTGFLCTSMITISGLGTTIPDFEQVGAAKNTNQVLRSNAKQYWAYQLQRGPKGALKSYLPFLGVVAGDPHMGNYGYRPVTPLYVGDENADNRVMEWTNIDWDDPGIGSLALDFARYVITVKDEYADIRKAKMEEAYIEGLRGNAIEPGDKIKKILATSVAEYDEKLREANAGRFNGRHLILKPNEVVKHEGSLTLEDLGKLFPKNYEVLDFAEKHRDRGGNMGRRFLILVKNPKQILEAWELKEREIPALAHYMRQPEIRTWEGLLQDNMLHGFDPKDYKLHFIPKLIVENQLESGWFWLRPKGVDLFDKKDVASELAIWNANKIGRDHHRNRSAAGFVNMIDPRGDAKANKAAREQFHRDLEDEVNHYLKVVQRVWDRRPEP